VPARDATDILYQDIVTLLHDLRLGERPTWLVILSANCAWKSTSVGQEGISRLEKQRSADLDLAQLRCPYGGKLELVDGFRDRLAVSLEDLAELDVAPPETPAPKKNPQRALPRPVHT
jgi:hypothetical protein